MKVKAAKHLIVYADNPYKDKVGSIYLDVRFDNQEKSKQVFTIVDAPNHLKHLVDEGDRALVHFNVVSFQIRNGEKVPSKYNFLDDFYNVPNDMIHAIIKEDGRFEMLNGWILIKPNKKSQEKKLDSGITLVRTDKMKMKHELMKGWIYKTNKEWCDMEEGEEVLLSGHSDYSVEIDGEEFWLVKDNSILESLRFIETIGHYED